MTTYLMRTEKFNNEAYSKDKLYEKFQNDKTNNNSCRESELNKQNKTVHEFVAKFRKYRIQDNFIFRF